MTENNKSVLVGEDFPIPNLVMTGRFLTNGHRMVWWTGDPESVSIGIPGDKGNYWASSDFDGWIDTTTYDEVGFFVKENGIIRFAKISFAGMEHGHIHAQAMVELWNQLTDKHYELMGEGIGWAVCKRSQNETPPGVELKEVHRFYHLDENLNPID